LIGKEISYIVRSISDLKGVGQNLLQAISTAHNCIIEGKEDVWDAGTTTLLGGVVVELKDTEDAQGYKYAFVCASVGDCKVRSFFLTLFTL
jgi:hypothetical protein